MDAILTYRRKSVSKQDIKTINEIIEASPGKSRRFISQEVCRAWDWRQPNGILKDMVCRSLLLILDSEGFIKLPPRKFTPPNPLANRKKPAEVDVDRTPVVSPLADLFPIKLKSVRRTRFEKIFNGLVSEYHYLGYTHWSKEVREKNLHLIANNLRFLILPWVQVSCLASYLLALNRHRLSQDWQNLYHHPVYLLETFVDTERYLGTCYKADNWICVGQTTGQGKLSKSRQPLLSKKAVYVYPLTKNFRRELCHDA